MATLMNKIVNGIHYACIVDEHEFYVSTTHAGQDISAGDIVFAGYAEDYWNEEKVRQAFPEHES